MQAFRQLSLDKARRHFPTGEEGICGDCYFKLSVEEINTGIESMAHEVALNSDSRVSFRIELSELERSWDDAYFTHFRVRRRIVAKKD
jgi:hypothetical protein